MFSALNINEILKIIVVTLFAMGAISLASGIFILFKKVMGEELKIIANQTAKLAQKGLAEELGDETRSWRHFAAAVERVLDTPA